MCPHHCEAPFHQLELTLSHRSSAVRLFHALQGFVQCHIWVFEVLFPQFQSRSISSQKCCPCALGHKSPLRCLLPPASHKGPSLFETFIWLPHSRCLAHCFAVLVQILPVAAFKSFVDCLAKGMPISTNQGRSPPVLRYVIDIDARFLGAHFLGPLRQFLGTLPDRRLRALPL